MRLKRCHASLGLLVFLNRALESLLKLKLVWSIERVSLFNPKKGTIDQVRKYYLRLFQFLFGPFSTILPSSSVKPLNKII
jgi:hypothetical protein